MPSPSSPLSPFKAVYRTFCTGWLIEYPGRGGDTPRDFFADAGPAAAHPVMRKGIGKERGGRDAEGGIMGGKRGGGWDSGEDEEKM